MANLLAPGLGPIVGDTTDTTCRIWIRARHQGDVGAAHDPAQRTVGIIGFVNPGNTIGNAWYFRVHREDDRTGTFKLGEFVQLGRHPADVARERQAKPGAAVADPETPKPLTPDTAYTIRVGTFAIDDPTLNAESLPDWQLRDLLPPIDTLKQQLLGLPAEESEARFRTFPKSGPAIDRLAFLLGSCRYPGAFNSAVKRADETFAPMREHFGNKHGEPARFTLMVGDQIYGDRNGPLDPLDYAAYQERYLVAWGTKHFRRLARSSTTYMILDDHEITDNWTMDEVERGKANIYAAASTAYLNYQWSHSPRTWGKKAYYKFDCGGYPVFVLDTRNGRYKNNRGLRDNHLLGFPDNGAGHPGQLEFLLDWLAEQQERRGNVPKFIVTSSVFVPAPISQRLDPLAGLAIDERLPPQPIPQGDEAILYEANVLARDASDAWPAYPNTRLAILRQIVKRKVQNVIWLSGDIHCSCVAEIDFDGPAGAKKLKSFAVTSSPFFWNLGHDDPNGYVANSRAEGQTDTFPILKTNTTMNYRAYGFASLDNFTRVEIDKAAATLTVRVFNRDGNPVTVADRNGKKTTANVLKLASW